MEFILLLIRNQIELVYLFHSSRLKLKVLPKHFSIFGAIRKLLSNFSFKGCQVGPFKLKDPRRGKTEFKSQDQATPKQTV